MASIQSIGSGRIAVFCAVASGSVVLAIAGVYWYRRFRQQQLKRWKPQDLKNVVATVDKLWVYPLKSAYRVEVEEIECTKRGFLHDRCWVVADENVRMLSQKRAPKLATIVAKVHQTEDGQYTLVVTAPGKGELIIPQPDQATPFTSLSLFSMAGMGQDVGDEAAAWVSDCIGMPGCRMYYMASTSKPRKSEDHPKFGEMCMPEDESSFSNFSPVFVVSEESLKELHTRMETPMPMTRFRPNIAIKGCSRPHEEDSWKYVRIGDTCIFKLITPGPRCGVTTIDQELGEPAKSNEPLDTLNTYRRYDQVYGEHDHRYTSGPLFGSNFSVLVPGKIKLGDSIYVA